MNLVDKYEPKDLKNLIGHKDQIKKIQELLNSDYNKTFLIMGPNGCGKSITVKVILKELGFKIKMYDTVTNSNANLIQEMININHNNIKYLLSNVKNTTKTALIIDNLDHITLSNEKTVIDSIISYNIKNKKFPLILIINSLNPKFLDEYKDHLIKIVFHNHSKHELGKYLEFILKNEDIKVSDKYVISSLIDFSQKDIRRMFYILHDIINSFNTTELSKSLIDEYISKSLKKNIDMNLFDSLKEIISSSQNIPRILSVYNTDKVLLPLTLHENYIKHLNFFTDEKLSIISRISDYISKGDMIETDIYTDQNWDLQQTHCFFSIIRPVSLLNTQKKISSIDDIKYNISFSSELNKTSLKNINRKNIFNLNSYLNSSVIDILDKSFLLNELFVNNKFDEINEIMGGYSDDKIKLIEVILKIDKCNKNSNTLNTKIKKIFL